MPIANQIPTQEELCPNKDEPITIERLDNAIVITAYCMQRHNLRQLFTTLKRLEAAREKLRADGDPIEYAKRILERSTIVVQPRLIDQRRDAA
jgi:cell division protein FtsL